MPIRAVSYKRNRCLQFKDGDGKVVNEFNPKDKECNQELKLEDGEEIIGIYGSSYKNGQYFT